MPPQRTKSERFSTAVPPSNARSVLATNNHPRLPYGAASPLPAKRGVQRASSRAEMIFAQIQAEYAKLLNMNHELLSMNHELRGMLKKGKDEQAALEVQMQYQNDCLQAAEQRSWGLEERVSKLEVELASRNADITERRPPAILQPLLSTVGLKEISLNDGY